MICQWNDLWNPGQPWNLKHDVEATVDYVVNGKDYKLCRWHTVFIEINPGWPNINPSKISYPPEDIDAIAGMRGIYEG